MILQAKTCALILMVGAIVMTALGQLRGALICDAAALVLAWLVIRGLEERR